VCSVVNIFALYLFSALFACSALKRFCPGSINNSVCSVFSVVLSFLPLSTFSGVLCLQYPSRPCTTPDSFLRFVRKQIQIPQSTNSSLITDYLLLFVPFVPHQKTIEPRFNSTVISYTKVFHTMYPQDPQNTPKNKNTIWALGVYFVPFV